MINFKNIKKEFPILKTKVNGKDLVYLDNAATTQKPKSVINKITEVYENYNANVHRGIYSLSEKSTEMYENTRENIVKFINAKSIKEIVFTRNCTESINLVANSWAKNLCMPGDEIIVSILEHHSNLVPWQEVSKVKGAKLIYVPLLKSGELDMDFFINSFSDRTKLVCVTGMSNVLGIKTDLKRIIKSAHQNNVKVLVDAAQLAGHSIIDVQDLDADFLAFSSHKMLGPTGVGVLYAKEEILEEMYPYIFGGDMIRSVDKENSVYADLPTRFEAGTPNFADIIAFDEALKFLNDIGLENIEKYERNLFLYAKSKLEKMKNLELYIPENHEICGGIISFNVLGVHAHDVASILDQEGICIRAGMLCAQPLVKDFLKENAVARISFYLYNDEEDVEKLVTGLEKV